MSAPTVVSRALNRRTRWSHGWPLPFQLWFPLSVYVASRLVAAAYMVAAAGPRSGYADLATAWDGDWYRLIATSGYPSSLPIGASGRVVQNAWAFSPAYPLIVRWLMTVTGLSFSVVAPTLSLLLGAAAMTVIFVLMERAVSRFTACACVVLTCTFMAAPALQLSYAESLALLLVASALLLLRERKYLAVGFLLLALALTRPVVLAFVPVVITHGVVRWRGRIVDSFPAKDRRGVVLLTGWCLLATGLWPVIVAVFTGNILGWTNTQRAWRPGSQFVSGMGWPSSFLLNYGWPAVALLSLVVMLSLGVVVRPGARAWGPELRCWCLTYPSFLLLATVPVPSVIRWLLLAFPLMWPFPDPAVTRSEQRFRVILIASLAVVGLAMQWVWVSSFLGATAPSDRYP